MYKILALDGGGIRGLIAATLLLELENKCKKPLNQVFDLITGTSTGAIETCLLACDYSAKDIISFYTGNDAKTIFSPYFLPTHKAKFNPDNIDSVLKNRFQDKKLSDLKTNVLVPSYDLIKRNTMLFSNLDNNYLNFYLRDVARASSAAPYYFTPHEFNGLRCIDGGLSANNPSMCAYTYIKNKFPDIKDITVVSIGAGSFEHEIEFDDMCACHPFSFIPNLMDCFMDGNSDTVELEAKNILKNNYFRFQLTLTKELSDIDNVTDANLNGLQALTKSYINGEWSNSLNKLCAVL